MTTPTPQISPDRRPLETRKHTWAIALAGILVKLGLSPNIISLASIFFAALACAALCTWQLTSGHVFPRLLLVAAAGCIQLRLLCNMLDGMVAIEGNMRSKTGDLFNEIPDRFADALILVGAGYAALPMPHAVELGWLAAALAILTAYIRALGKSLGTPMFFHGPMAKPHRMAAVTFLALASAIYPTPQILYYGLILITLGTLLTVARRTRLVAKDLNK